MATAATPPIAIRLRSVSRHFGEVRALEEVSLEVGEGEFFSLLGPSGSGKTTCLRLVAGFDEPTSGSVELHGRNVVGVPPYERDVNTVFQDYALFPHMTVAQNVGYGLRVKGVLRAQVEGRVREALELVRLPGLAERRPAQLSGGQRQRVALARSLVNRPRVLLLDEPLGALDLKLRQEMQVELRALQRQVGITFLYVTHDQEEALSMSDRLAVFREGHIDQVGTPAEVYETPHTTFVAGFVGASNHLAGDLARAATGNPEAFLVRPEKMRLLPAAPELQHGADAASECSLLGTIRDALYLGPFTRYRVSADAGGEVFVLEQNQRTGADEVRDAAGHRVRVSWLRALNRRLDA
ncbi:MAG TPA: ABC transporter ATP-binding protein [Vicinamibacteria bacterium]